MSCCFRQAMAAAFSLPGTLRQGTGVDEILARWAVMPPLAAAGILGFPVALLLYDGLGNRALPAIASLVALLFTPMLPLLRRFSGDQKRARHSVVLDTGCAGIRRRVRRDPRTSIFRDGARTREHRILERC